MRWVRAGKSYQLVVLPLHGRGNKGGEGKGVKVFAYAMPADPATQPWKLSLLDDDMHLTHNLDIVTERGRDVVYIGGKEGVKAFTYEKDRWSPFNAKSWAVEGRSFGEVRAAGPDGLIAGIEPMHGNELTVYPNAKGIRMRQVLTSDLGQGHALAIDDLLGNSKKQIVVGWREPNKQGKVGIKLFAPAGDSQWKDYWVDDNGMACEDLQVADLNGDGKPDIIASGRATKNLKVYWNRN